DDFAYALVLQPDGKIVLAGSTQDSSLRDEFALVRYLPDGSLDGAFGSGGKVTTDVSQYEDYADALALQPDGQLVASGPAWDAANPRFAVVRYNVDGTLDGSFGSSGIASTGVGGFSETLGMALQPDGRIVAVGLAGVEPLVVRYLAAYPKISIAGASATEGNTGTTPMSFTVSLSTPPGS